MRTPPQTIKISTSHCEYYELTVPLAAVVLTFYTFRVPVAFA